MRNTKARPGPFDPLDRMPEDEPRFVLRGKDPATPSSITEWARVTRNAALKEFGDNPREGTREHSALQAILLKCHEAEELAMEICDWQTGAEDMPGSRARYANDADATEEQMQQLNRRKRLDDVMRHIQEGRYHVCEVRDQLDGLDMISDDLRDELTAMLERLQRVCDRIDPKHPDFADQKRLPLEVPD